MIEPDFDTEAKASLAELVAHFLLHEVDSASLEALRQPDMLESLDKLEPGCREYLSRDWSDHDFEQAAVDYCSLFVLPRGAPPFASAWLGGSPHEHGPRLLAQIGDVANRLDVEAAYASLPADHLGILLSLLAEAWRQGEADAAEKLDRELLGPTVSAFCRTVRGQSQNLLYRAIAGLLAQLIPRR